MKIKARNLLAGAALGALVAASVVIACDNTVPKDATEPCNTSIVSCGMVKPVTDGGAGYYCDPANSVARWPTGCKSTEAAKNCGQDTEPCSYPATCKAVPEGTNEVCIVDQPNGTTNYAGMWVSQNCP